MAKRPVPLYDFRAFGAAIKAARKEYKESRKGVFTIVAESSGTGSTKGWGKLKSGAGWISLDYAIKV